MDIYVELKNLLRLRAHPWISMVYFDCGGRQTKGIIKKARRKPGGFSTSRVHCRNMKISLSMILLL